MGYEYDVVAVGGGAAGLSASVYSASFGAKTALVESKRLGGDCTWYGCVPSKTLLNTAKIVHHSKSASRYGLENMQPKFDFKKVTDHVHRIQQHIYEDADAPVNYEKYGIYVINAEAKFIDKHTLELKSQDGNTTQLTSRIFIIATGSSPIIPPIEGIEDVDYLTNETIFSLIKLPKHLVIVGGGPIGTEMSQAFSRLGSQVTVIASNDRILKKDDPELAGILGKTLESEGIRFHFNTQAKSIENITGGVKLTVVNKLTSKETVIEADAILVAAGRRANISGLNLEACGVKYDRRGILVDDYCRTSTKTIYACGDAADRFQFTHFAEHMAKTAAFNAVLHFPTRLDSKHITWCTYTDPELAHVGLGGDELRKKGVSYGVYRFPFSKVDRAITEDETNGWVKVYARNFDGKIYGVDILGSNAGELIGEYALAMRNNVPLRKISNTIHPYPTYALGNRRAADQWYARKQSRTIIWLVQKLFGYRGRLPDTSDPEKIM